MPRGWGRAATQRARVGGASFLASGELAYGVDEDYCYGHEESDDDQGDL